MSLLAERPPLLGRAALDAALSVPDLTDPAAAGPHALQLLVDLATTALAARWGCPVQVHRRHPIVPVADNYDRLRFPPHTVTRDARYTRYVSETCMLRSHTSAMIPAVLRELAAAGPPADVVLACPGVVYRRDAIDRLHTGTPHQLDLWRVVDGAQGTDDLETMIETVVAALLPGRPWRAVAVRHPYTEHGRQIDVHAGGEWVEIGECGVASPLVLRDAGLDPMRWGGLAMGLGLDRILMLRKGLDDIRLIRSADPRVRQQLLDLEPWRAVSNQPPIVRDVSVAVTGEVDDEVLGDRVREALGDAADAVEEVAVLSQTPAADLPPAAAARLGIREGQHNVLLRVVLRAVDRTLTRAEANELRDQIAAAIHEGAVAV